MPAVTAAFRESLSVAVCAVKSKTVVKSTGAVGTHSFLREEQVSVVGCAPIARGPNPAAVALYSQDVPLLDTWRGWASMLLPIR